MAQSCWVKIPLSRACSTHSYAYPTATVVNATLRASQWQLITATGQVPLSLDVTRLHQRQWSSGSRGLWVSKCIHECTSNQQRRYSWPFNICYDPLSRSKLAFTSRESASCKRASSTVACLFRLFSSRFNPVVRQRSPQPRFPRFTMIHLARFILPSGYRYINFMVRGSRFFPQAQTSRRASSINRFHWQERSSAGAASPFVFTSNLVGCDRFFLLAFPNGSFAAFIALNCRNNTYGYSTNYPYVITLYFPLIAHGSSVRSVWLQGDRTFSNSSLVNALVAR